MKRTKMTMKMIKGDIRHSLTVYVQNKEKFENLTYQWYRNDVPIDGATFDTYALTFQDYHDPDQLILKHITVQVSGDVDLPEDEVPLSSEPIVVTSSQSFNDSTLKQAEWSLWICLETCIIGGHQFNRNEKYWSDKPDNMWLDDEFTEVRTTREDRQHFRKLNNL